MELKVTRELLGRVGQQGWRPALIGWGLGLTLVMVAFGLGLGLVVRFWNGTIQLQDFAALAAFIPLAHYIHLRGAPAPVAPTGGLVNNEALA